MDSTSFQSILAAVQKKRELEGGSVSDDKPAPLPSAQESTSNSNIPISANSQTTGSGSTVAAKIIADNFRSQPSKVNNALHVPGPSSNNVNKSSPVAVNNVPKSHREMQTERRERILSNKGKVENTTNATHVQRKFEKYKKIVVSRSQTGNPLLKHLRIEYSINNRDLDVDYGINSHCYVVYLTLSYHNTNPGYIESRLKRIRGDYDPMRIRVLLCVVDIQNHEKPIRDITKMCIMENMTMIVAWSPSEAASYINNLKQCEAGVGKSIIKGGNNSDAETDTKLKLSNRMVESLTSIRSISKTNAVALVSKYGSMGRLVQEATEEDLSEIQGMGEVRVHDFLRVVGEPFVAKRG